MMYNIQITLKEPIMIGDFQQTVFEFKKELLNKPELPVQATSFTIEDNECKLTVPLENVLGIYYKKLT